MFKKLFICLLFIINSLIFAYSDQVVVSQFDIGLKASASNNNYSLTGISSSGDIKAVNSLNLSNTASFNASIGNSFTGSSNDLKFNYTTGEKSMVIPVVRNESTNVVNGSFQLTETNSSSGESVSTYYIQNSITLPAKTIALTQDTTVSTGVKFTYSDSAKAKHLAAYKKQEFMIRIAKASSPDTNYDIIAQKNGIQQLNSNNSTSGTTNAEAFFNGITSYVDFWVTGDTYDKAQSDSSKATGLGLKFMPEDIEVFGLPKGQYRIEVYSFRYSKEVSTKGNLVVTKEDYKTFTVGNNEFSENGIDIMKFSSSDFPNVKATILTVGTTTSPSIVVSENGATMTATKTSTAGSIYLDNTTSSALNIGINGTEYGGKYYQLWSIDYTATDKSISTNSREVIYKKDNQYVAKTTYSVISSAIKYTNEPLYQTVFIGTTDGTYSNGEFEISDRLMSKYSDGYRSVRSTNVSLTNSSINIESIYKGNYTPSSLSLNSKYNWSGSVSNNSLIITKVMSDSKGTYTKVSDTGKSLTFYTTNWEPNLSFYEASDANNTDDTIKFKWESPKKSSYDVTLSEDKVFFRIIKSSSNSESLRYKPESSSNPIKESTSANLTAFLSDTTNTKYFDVLFKSGEDGSLSLGNVEFSFGKNNTLKVVGLDVGTYQMQIYSIQNEDTVAQEDKNYDYRVLTYGGVLSDIKFGLPELEKDKYTSYKNPYIIDSINVTTDSTTGDKKVEVGLVIKADQQIKELTKANLIARKDEETTNSAFYYKNENALLVEAWKPNYSGTGSAIVYNDVKVVDPSVINVYKSAKADFKYPLDIVFLIDNSASMDNEIASVRDGLVAFSQDLSDRGYAVNYNVVQFGGSTSTSAWYTDVSSVVSLLKNIKSGGGFSNKQENGAQAIKTGTSQLRTYGRYLNKKLGIWSTTDGTDQKYMPSKKWIILLTDENMDKDQVSGLGYSSDRTSDSYVVKKLSDNLVATNNGFQDNITLTGIYHLNTLMTNLDASVNNSGNTPTANTSTNDLTALTTAITKEGAKYTSYNNGYIYNKDTNNPKGYIGNFSGNSNYIGPYTALAITDKLGKTGTFPSDSKDIFYTEFTRYAGSLFSMYEMGEAGEFVSGALTESVKDIGVIQRWVISYTSPYGKEFTDAVDKKIKGGSDGELREVMFSLYNVKNYKDSGTLTLQSAISPVKVESGTVTSSRNYTAPITKIEANFLNPNDTNRQLEKRDGLINLKAKARSQYKKDSNWVNYPITKGTFIITGNYSNDGITLGSSVSKIVSSETIGSETVSLTDTVESGSTWYDAEANLNAKTFTTLFGKKPKNVEIKFIAETVEGSKTISLSGLNVVDKTNPKVIDFEIVNNTLADFMRTLQNYNSTRLFSETDVEKATQNVLINTAGLSASDFNKWSSEGTLINAKASDKMRIYFSIEDESITSTSQGVKVIYNGNTYLANYAGTTTTTLPDNSIQEKTNWAISLDKNLAYQEGATSLELNITDDSSSPNTTQISTTMFKEPTLIGATKLKPRSTITTDSDYNVAGPSFSNYYNNKEIQVTATNKEALAYLINFSEDKTKKDSSATNIITYPKINDHLYQSSLDGKFNFGDGKYDYSEVYIINKAGAISKSSVPLASIAYGGTLEGALNTISLISADKTFYVDTVIPTISNLSLIKTSDPSLLDSNLLGNNTVASGKLLGAISTTRPYKGGDGLELQANISEYNFLNSQLGQANSKEIFSSVTTYTGSNELIKNSVNGAEENSSFVDGVHLSASVLYKKIGIANDLTVGNASLSTSTRLTVYDKAGNKGESTITIPFDDSIPNSLIVASVKTGNGHKFTSNRNIPLETVGTGYSVGLLSSGANRFIGNLSGGGTINLTSFSTNAGTHYAAIENSDNLFTLRGFSNSGMPSNANDDGIVLDTAINDTKTSIVETHYSFVGGMFNINLTNTLSTISELVGLESYTISTSAQGTKLKTGDSEDDISISGVAKTLTNSGFNNVARSTSYISTNTLLIPTAGRTRFNLTLRDRLGNENSIEYIVEIPRFVSIVGKTESSSKQVTIKVNGASTNLLIESRKE